MRFLPYVGWLTDFLIWVYWDRFWRIPRSMAALPALRCRISHAWVKLSNSGEALKLLILSHIWKYMSGWTYYSEIVTSQEMIEREMGYRGSKSATGLNRPTSQIKPGAVKEQRVDGSYANNLALRCTLMGFERSYQIKVLSNQKRFYINYDPNLFNPSQGLRMQNQLLIYLFNHVLTVKPSEE